ncbi:Meiotic activator RIM4 [Fusarium oxysporum f. sp. albedinis]|nr:hypothetical protein FOMA001_g10137 [Fusarium oxysporum f. sp. matthiolae]KAJ0151960.1 Meiotic activator RIM4 [Fusarium oxysporum f. sp. albedinis]KAK2478322.1 hypothetical protein H9L39_10810 [Fusarium oxysporum f. sp. albedinis]
MATTCSIDQLLLASIPNLPWPDGNYTKTLQAVVLTRDWKYDDTTHNVPNVIKGRMPTRLLVNGRLPLFKNEPGYLFYEGRETAMVMVVKGTMVVPVVLPTVILTKGAMLRPLAEQTANLLPSLTSESTPAPEVHDGGRPFSRFVHSLWQTLAKNTRQLQTLGMSMSAIDACFAGPHLLENRNAILNAVLPPAREVLKDGTFSLKDLLDLRHVSGDWPAGRQCVYLRIYTHPQDRPDYRYSDSSQADINKNVGFYIGSTNNAQRRNQQHEHATDNRSNSCYEMQHYRIARKSQKQHRHMIPLVVFDAIVPIHLLKMAEQTFILAFRSYQGVIHAPVNTGGSSGLVGLQRKGQFLSSIARPVMDAVAWPALKTRGCNMSSSLFEDQTRVELLCSPMVPGDASVRTFTTYRLRRNLYPPRNPNGSKYVSINLHEVNTGIIRHVVFGLPFGSLEMQGPKPGDSTGGYLVFEVMDDKKAHPKAWFGVPSIGPFENFDRASSFAVRYEWYDKDQQKWYSIPLSRWYWGLNGMKEHIAEGRTEKVLEPWRIAMDIVQAIEGIIYTEPLNDFKPQIRVGEVKMLQTDHLGQQYSWITRPMRTMPAPRYATFNENFALMYRQFNTQLTHVGPTEPIPRDADVLYRAPGDNRDVVRCDSCLYMGENVKCERDERITDAWVCKCCFILYRPCSFTALSDALELWGQGPPYRGAGGSARLRRVPSGPHRFMAYHLTMTEEEMVTVKAVPKPLSEHLLEPVDLDDGDGDDDVVAEVL